MIFYSSMCDMEELKKLTVDLVVHRKLKHTTLLKEIRAALLQEAEKYPKVPVLYCASPGGYKYSLPFEEFLFTQQKNKQFTSSQPYYDRLMHVSAVKDFGMKCGGTYPFIRKIVLLYTTFEIGHVCECIGTLLSCERDIDIVKASYEIVKAAPESCFGEKTEIPPYIGTLYISNNQPVAYDFTREALLLACKNKLKLLEDRRHTALGVIVSKLGRQVWEENIEDILKAVDARFVEDRPSWSPDNIKRDSRWSGSPKRKTSFIDAVKLYGEEHPAVWHCQNQFDFRVISFLFMTGMVAKLERVLVSKKDIDDQIYMHLGLLFASGPFCRLAIHMVPQFLEWKIGEYNGLETIYVL